MNLYLILETDIYIHVLVTVQEKDFENGQL